jgi:mannose-6-phosphate isomerase-like protein (cupin superfamily)
MSEPFDLTATPVHLGLGATAVPLPGFSWDPSYFGPYLERTAADGDEGRLVTMFNFDEPWSVWEAHPRGAELVVCVSGRATVIQQDGGEVRRVDLGAGQAIVNPPGVWHTADTGEATTMLFVTAGRGTEHRPRDD